MPRSPFEQMQELMTQILAVRYSDLELERELCLKLLETAERERYTYGTAFAHTYLGDYYIAQNDSARCGDELRTAKSICVQNSFPDLLLRIYNLLGICYESLSDEQSALQQYLNALDLAEKYPDASIQCIVLNNIASDFELRGDYEEAVEYYKRSLQYLPQCQQMRSYQYIQLRIWANLSESLISLGNLDEAAQYLILCNQLDTEESVAQSMLLCRSGSRFWAAKGDTDKARACAERILDAKSEELRDKYLVFELLIEVCKTMISISDQEYAKRILDRILSMYTGDEIDRARQIQTLKVRYCEAFSSKEELNLAHRDFYLAVSKAEAQSNQVRADGMKAALRLHTALREKDAAVEDKRKIEDEAHLDELTDLYNRRYFNKLVSKWALDKDLTYLGFIMLDVDYFKEYNDTYGHREGDNVLKSVADALRSCADEHILTARYGGDEFVCLCLDRQEQDIEAYIHAVRGALADLAIEHVKSHCSKCITLSIGYYNEPTENNSKPDFLIERADQALYRAKIAGRNTWSK